MIIVGFIGLLGVAYVVLICVPVFHESDDISAPVAYLLVSVATVAWIVGAILMLVEGSHHDSAIGAVICASVVVIIGVVSSVRVMMAVSRWEAETVQRRLAELRDPGFGAVGNGERRG